MSTSLRRLVRVGGVATACLLTLTACSNGGTGGGNEDIITAVADIRVINPALVAVDFNAENTGGATVTLECEVSVIDPDGTSEGSQRVSVPDVAPGAVQPASVQVEVSDEGAEFVTQASVECTGS